MVGDAYRSRTAANRTSVNHSPPKIKTTDALGNTEENGGEAIDNPFRYNGQYTDEETGLIYLRNRYYDPEIGRFISEDPVKDGLNWYAYCGNNPINYVDPWGLASISDYCDNVDSLSTQERKNIMSAINANIDGFLSYEEMLYNIVDNNGNILQDKKLNAVTISLNENNINVTAYIHAYGTAANVEVGGSGYTYVDIAEIGIESYWNLEFEGMNFSVNAIMQDDKIHNCLELNISYENSSTSTQMAIKGRPMKAKISPFERQYDAEPKSELIRLNNYIQHRMYDFAHEFGHSAFGLQDLYNTGIKNVDSLMGTAYSVDKAQPIDISLVLQNYKINNLKGNIWYQNYFNLLDKYSPGWGIVKE